MAVGINLGIPFFEREGSEKKRTGLDGFEWADREEDSLLRSKFSIYPS